MCCVPFLFLWACPFGKLPWLPPTASQFFLRSSRRCNLTSVHLIYDSSTLSNRLKRINSLTHIWWPTNWYTWKDTDLMNIPSISLCRAVTSANDWKNPLWTLKPYTWFRLPSYPGWVPKRMCWNSGKHWRQLCNNWINFKSHSYILKRRVTSKMISLDFILIFKLREFKGNEIL